MTRGKILVTGAAGFIGNHVCDALLRRGDRVVGVDNLDDYYDVTLKEARLERLRGRDGFDFARGDVSDREGMERLFAAHGDIAGAVHLAAQAGVRYSLVNPYAYIQANVLGHTTLLECARRFLPDLQHFVYASSSSVYGGNTDMPFSVEDRVDNPISLYAATKKSCELISHCYAHLYRVRQTGLRFFTVYGPWGRPDMAAFIFTRKILAGEPIQVFNRGDMRRDFTFIDDIVAGVLSALDRPPADGEGAGTAPARVYNIGNRSSEKLTDFIAILERALGRKAEIELCPMQPGDVRETCADIDATREDLDFQPSTPIAVGLPRFVEWYREFYGV